MSRIIAIAAMRRSGPRRGRSPISRRTACRSAFAACPTFQDWARREAARARGSNGGPALDGAEVVDLDPVPIVAATGSDGAGDGPPDPEPAGRAVRRSRRAEPPSRLGRSAAVVRPRRAPRRPCRPTRRRSWPRARPGPSGDEVVAAAGLSASRWIQDVPTPRTPDGAGAPDKDPDDELERALAEDRANRERSAALAGASATASSSRAARRAVPPAAPQKVSQARRTPPGRDVTGPAWERPRRFEAYPTLKTRIGPPVDPAGGSGGAGGDRRRDRPLLGAVRVPSRRGRRPGRRRRRQPQPEQRVGRARRRRPRRPLRPPRSMSSRPATRCSRSPRSTSLTVDQLLAANKKIKNPNKIAVGDEIVIPVAPPTEVVDGASGAPGSEQPASAAP